jgi:pyridoxine kinase
MNILSIQSHVAYGHVGNAAAVFPLQRLGIEVWPVHTVQFSNHPGYGAFRGRVLDADLIREVVQGIDERGLLGACDGVLSGYVGSVEIGEGILDAVGRVKEDNPLAQYCCDPVIGDADRGVFVATGVPEFMRDRAVLSADVLTPNQFELEHLTGCPTSTMAEVRKAVETVHARGPRVVLVTSLQTRETPKDALDVLVSDHSGCCRVRTPNLPLQVNGAGDALAALFFGHLLQVGAAGQAASLAVSSLFGVLSRTLEAGSGEIMLVEAQDELVEPSRIFEPEQL